MEELETVNESEQVDSEQSIAEIETKKKNLAPELIALMPTSLTESQQVEWLEKAEVINLTKTEKTVNEQDTQIGSYTQQLAREHVAELEKELTVTEQIEKHFKALKTKY